MSHKITIYLNNEKGSWVTAPLSNEDGTPLNQEQLDDAVKRQTDILRVPEGITVLKASSSDRRFIVPNRSVLYVDIQEDDYVDIQEDNDIGR